MKHEISNRSIKRSITGVSVILILTFFFIIGLLLFQKYRAISVIERSGGHIGFDYHDYGPNKNSIPNIGIWAETEKVSNEIREDSLHRWIECPVLGHPYVVSLKTVNEEVLRAVKRFPTIRRLSFWGLEPKATRATSKDWFFLEECSELRFLAIHFRASLHDDDFLSRIHRWPKLSWLLLSGTNCSDRGLAHCVDHPSLNVLFVDGKGITDSAVDSLKRIPKLAWLQLGNDVSISEKAILKLLDEKPLLWVSCHGRHYKNISKSTDDSKVNSSK